MIEQLKILANGDEMFPRLIFFAILIGLSIASSVIKKYKEAQQEQQERTSRPPRPTKPARPVSSKYSQTKTRAATPTGASARDVLNRPKIKRGLSSIGEQKPRQLKPAAKPTRYSKPPAKVKLPSQTTMAGDAVLIPDKPRRVVSKKVQEESRKISKVARRHMAPKVEARHIKASTEVTNVIAAKMAGTDIQGVAPIKGIREMVADRNAFRKAFVIHEILLTPKALRES